MTSPRAGLSAPLTGLLLLILPNPAASSPTPDCSDSTAWNNALRGAEGVYATVWGNSGVVGCQGLRGRLEKSGAESVFAVLEDALDEAGPPRAAHVRLAKISVLGRGRSLASDASFDPSMESLLVSRGEASVVILRGEARTPSFAWRRARARLGVPAGGLVSGRVYQTRQYTLDSQALDRWRNACRPAPGTP
jgi:hypothetical protein